MINNKLSKIAYKIKNLETNKCQSVSKSPNNIYTEATIRG